MQITGLVRPSIREKTATRIWLVIGGLTLFLAGCVTTGLEPNKEFASLLTRLQRSGHDNRIARAALKARGQSVVPYLLDELDIPAHKLRRGESALRAARVLRVLKEMKAQEVLPVSRRILIDSYIKPNSPEGAAVLNEAIGCVYALFPDPKARDIYYAFVTGDSRQYMKEELTVQHWGAGAAMNRLAVDVLTGFHKMVEAKDPRTQDALMIFLDHITGGALERMYFPKLAENGYSITQLTVSGKREELEQLKAQ